MRREYMKPWISVIVPVYNVEAYLERCMLSLINQTCKKIIEIVLVDDGSTDSSGEMCDQYEKQYENVKVIHKENGGLASARNEGLKCAEGEYIAFVDSDDWIEKEAYKVLFEKCQECYPDIITYGYQKIKNNQILLKEHAYFPEGIYEKEEIQSLILPDSIARKKAFDQVNLPVQLSACMCIYKLDFLKENNLQFESERVVLSEDWLFNIGCLCRANSIIVIHNIFYNYDTREDSLSMSYKTDSYERKFNLYKRYREEVLKTGSYNSTMELRLKNFWVEAIYGCYIIELNAPIWNEYKVNKICRDEEFVANIKELTFANCTIKGIIFKSIVRLKAHWLLRITYKVRGNIRNKRMKY